jgi:hypothetical protein
MYELRKIYISSKCECSFKRLHLKFTAIEYIIYQQEEEAVVDDRKQLKIFIEGNE